MTDARRSHRQTCAAILACVFTFCGCGSPLTPPPPGSPDDDGLAPAGGAFEFEDDAEPVMATLPFVPTELLVQPFPGATTDSLNAAYASAGATVMDTLSDIQLIVLQVNDGTLNEAAAALDSTGLFEAIAKNYVLQVGRTPSDPEFAEQTHLTYVRAPQGWDVTTGTSDILIAIVDTGVDGTHPDLEGKLLDGWNVYSGDANYADLQGHGTLVAGVAAAATDNATGVAGLSWNSPIVPIRAADATGKSNTRYVSAGILWAASHGAKVINVSFAPLFADRVIRSAVEQAYHRGSLVVMSAGNGGGTHTSPGYAEGLFVSAIDVQSKAATFTDRGPFVDVCAPGVAVLTTSRGGGYQAVDGTSFASPLVAGIAAVAWSVNPRLRPVSIVEALTSSTTDLGSTGLDSTFGYGAVDLPRAIDAVVRTEFTPDTTPPTISFASPAPGAKLRGRASISITAQDATGIADVVLSIDGIPFATDTRSPFQFVIDTALFSAGSHELSAVATDLDGNASSRRRMTVTFERSTTGATTGATIRFSSPAAGATVSGDVSIRATVRDADGLSNVEWSVNGVPAFAAALSGTSSGISYVWRGIGVPTGRHTITVTVTDTTGQRTSSNLELRR